MMERGVSRMTVSSMARSLQRSPSAWELTSGTFGSLPRPIPVLVLVLVLVLLLLSHLVLLFLFPLLRLLLLLLPLLLYLFLLLLRLQLLLLLPHQMVLAHHHAPTLVFYTVCFAPPIHAAHLVLHVRVLMSQHVFLRVTTRVPPRVAPADLPGSSCIGTCPQTCRGSTRRAGGASPVLATTAVGRTWQRAVS